MTCKHDPPRNGGVKVEIITQSVIRAIYSVSILCLPPHNPHLTKNWSLVVDYVNILFVNDWESV